MTVVSCILPVYNGERYVEQAIRSVLAQSFQDFELIVVDDGSTDRTPQIITQLACQDRRLKGLRQSNAGIVAALNAGCRLANGRYIARMDADDVCLPHRFAVQVAHLDRSPKCVIAGGLAQGFSEDGLQGITSGGRHRRTDLKPFPPKVAVAVHPLIMIRKEALDRLGGYRTLFPHAEDYDLFLRLAEFGTVDNLSDVILLYRRHPDAVSVRNLALQERNAAIAEACAIEEIAGGRAMDADADVEAVASKVWPAWLLEPYVAFRVGRRQIAAGDVRDGQRYIQMLRLASNLSPSTILSRRYLGLRIRILGFVAKSLAAR